MEEREIELVDLVWSHRWLLILGPLICIAVAMVATYFMPKQYESSLLLEVGTVADNQIQSCWFVSELINGEAFFEEVTKRLSGSERHLKRIHARVDSEKYSTGVRIRAAAAKPDVAVKAVSTTADLIIEAHTKLFEERMEPSLRYERELQSRIQSTNEQIENLKKILPDMKTRRDPIGEILGQSYLQERQDKLLAWERELRDLQMQNSKLHSRKTRVASPPLLSKKPTKPKMMVNVLVGLFIGAFLSVLLAFILEVRHKGRVVKERTQN